MRKRLISHGSDHASDAEEDWLALGRLVAEVEITSEDADHPIESALVAGSGWRAADPGPQTIRLLFDVPLRLRRVRLLFREDEHERTQEFVLRWSPDGGRSYREIVRQQFNFSPPGTVSEAEDYGIDLRGVTALELGIIPDLNRGSARASLAQLRLA